MSALNGSLPAELHDRRAVVTGAARGIGRAIVVRLVAAGAKVIAIDKDEAQLEALREEMGCMTVHHEFAARDPGNGHATTAGLAEDLLQGGPVELIVNNVGVSSERSFLQLAEDDWDRVVAINLREPWFFTKRLAEKLIQEKRPGAIVFISSLHQSVPSGQPHYSASKSGVAMLTKELALELAPRIRVNAITPGWIRTAPNHKTKDQVAKLLRLRRKIPLGEPGTVDDVARLALFLLSPLARYITGANIPVDGGLALHCNQWMKEPSHR